MTRLIVPGAHTTWGLTRPMPKRRFSVDKIVVVTGESGGDERLISFLRMLFPECEIQIVSWQPATSFGDVPVDLESSAQNKEGERNGKHLNCR